MQYNACALKKKSMPRKVRVTRKKGTAADDAFEVQLDRRPDPGLEVPVADSDANSVPAAESESGSGSGSVLNVAPAAEPESDSLPAEAVPEETAISVANAEIRDGQAHVIMGLVTNLQDRVNALQDRVRLLESESTPTSTSEATSKSTSDAASQDGVVFTLEYRRLLDSIKSKPIATMDFESFKRLLLM